MSIRDRTKPGSLEQAEGEDSFKSFANRLNCSATEKWYHRAGGAAGEGHEMDTGRNEPGH